MTAAATETRPARPAGLRWWKEVLAVAVFYSVYSAIRNMFGSEAVSPETAYDNAEIIVAVERAMGLFFEEALQAAFLGAEWFIRFWNIFYGTFHFVVTPIALIWLFRRDGWRYPRWRNTLAAMTALALIGFATFPLMPPRLLDNCGRFGACDPSYEFVDTLVDPGGLWSFDSSTMQNISNQYAAMPSLHVGWALWSTFVLWPLLRRRWLKALVAIYPTATIFGIVVTANHYWIDAVGGALVFAAAYGLVVAWDRWRASRRAAAPSRAAEDEPVPAGVLDSVDA